MSSENRSLRRRRVLKSIGGGTVALGVGTGVVSAQGNGGGSSNGMGGTGFTTHYNIKERDLLNWDAFKFIEENRFTLMQAPGCTNGQEKEYQGWTVEEVGGDGKGNLWVNPNRNVNTGEAVSITDVQGGCQGTVLEDGSSFGDDPRNTYRVTFGDA